MAWRAVLSLVLAASALAGLAAVSRSTPNVAPRWGATFSFAYADELKIDARGTFEKLLADFSLTRVRLPVDWDRVEKAEGEFDWSEIDWAMDAAERQGVFVVLAVGEKTPRWPECHTPLWARTKSETDRLSARLAFVHAAVERYAAHPALLRWQVENEPLFPYGACPLPDPQALLQEVDLVRALDPTHEIQMTVSGELEPWMIPASLSDVLGFSLYRKTADPFFGEMSYPFSPLFYRVRRLLVAPFTRRVVISELQVEPWFSLPIEARSAKDWLPAFNAEDLEENLSFAHATGAEEVYLWGVEWWAYLAEHGEPELWEGAKEALGSRR